MTVSPSTAFRSAGSLMPKLNDPRHPLTIRPSGELKFSGSEKPSFLMLFPWFFTGRRAKQALLNGNTTVFNKLKKSMDDRGKRLDLRHTDLSGRILKNVNFRGADLRGVNFERADLEGADLRGADLRGAKFIGANIAGVVIRGAKFEGNEFQGVSMKSIILDPDCPA